MKICNDCGYNNEDSHFEYEREVFDGDYGTEVDFYYRCPKCYSANVSDVKERPSVETPSHKPKPAI